MVNYLTETIVSIRSWQNIYTIMEILFLLGYFIFLYTTGLTGLFTKGNTYVYVPPLIYLLPTLLSVIIGFGFSQSESEYVAFPASIISIVAFVTDVIAFSTTITGLSNCVNDPQCAFVDAFSLFFSLISFLMLLIFTLLHGLGYMRYINAIDTNLQFRKMAISQYTEAAEEIAS